MGKIEHELAKRAAERQRLIDLCVRGLITAEEFEQRARKLDADARDLEAALPKPESVMDQRAAAMATVNLLAEFPYLSPPDQHDLARRVLPSTSRRMAAQSPGQSCVTWRFRDT